MYKSTKEFKCNLNLGFLSPNPSQTCLECLKPFTVLLRMSQILLRFVKDILNPSQIC